MIDKLIKAHNAQRINHIAKGFGGSAPKARHGLTQKEFNDRYEAGYNVFTQAGIDSFKKDALEKGLHQEEIDGQLKDLDKIFVQKGAEVVPLYVSKIEE